MSTTPVQTEAFVRAVAAEIEHLATHPFGTRQSGARIRKILAAALDVEEMAKVINEALMGYAPGTFDGVEDGAWNAWDDEIDVAKVAARIRASILGDES